MILYYRLELDEGNAEEDGEIPVIGMYGMSSFCELLVNLRMVPATLSPTL